MSLVSRNGTSVCFVYSSLLPGSRGETFIFHIRSAAGCQIIFDRLEGAKIILNNHNNNNNTNNMSWDGFWSISNANTQMEPIG